MPEIMQTSTVTTATKHLTLE